jgi:hypothetical protein
MSTLHVVARESGDEYMLVSMDGGVLAFDSKHVAEDFIDKLDEDGEFVVLDYDLAMGPCVVVT